MRQALRRKPLWQVGIRVSEEAEDAVSELLARRFGGLASSYTDLEAPGTPAANVSIYLGTRPGKLELQAASRAVRELRSYGLDCGRGVISVRRVAPRDWAESWKRHFRPLEIGGKLLVKPSWSSRRPRPGQAVLVLDPGLSFGTGRHATTAYCLEQIVRRRVPGAPQSVLDVGTGSGILALAAAAIGYSPVRAFDNDPEAVRSARENARRNGLDGHLYVCLGAIAESGVPARRLERAGGYTIVCANLTADLLLRVRNALVSKVAPGGWLVLAGILRREFHAVRRAYETAAVRLVSSRSEGEWRSGAFNRLAG